MFWAGLLLSCAWLQGCAESVVVAYESDAGEVDEIPASGAGGSAGTASTSASGSALGGSGGNGGSTTTSVNDLPERGDVIWEAGLETGDTSEWSEADQGGVYVANDAEVRVRGDHVRSGDYALEATLISVGQNLPQAMLLRDLDQREGYYSAYYCLQESYDTSYWVIMKFRGDGPFLGNTETADRFDIDLSTSDVDGQLHLQLDEHGGDSELSAIPVPINQWFRIEAFYKSTPEDDGRLIVWQDGVRVFDIGERPTAPSSFVSFGVGVAAWRVSPLPASIWIDDVSVYDVQ